MTAEDKKKKNAEIVQIVAHDNMQLGFIFDFTAELYHKIPRY